MEAVLLVFFLVRAFLGGSPAGNLYVAKTGTIHFKSEAPLELTEATSGKLNGVINTAEQTFAISVPDNSFEGFNSTLQREQELRIAPLTL